MVENPNGSSVPAKGVAEPNECRLARGWCADAVPPSAGARMRGRIVGDALRRKAPVVPARRVEFPVNFNRLRSELENSRQTRGLGGEPRTGRHKNTDGRIDAEQGGQAPPAPIADTPPAGRDGGGRVRVGVDVPGLRPPARLGGAAVADHRLPGPGRRGVRAAARRQRQRAGAVAALCDRRGHRPVRRGRSRGRRGPDVAGAGRRGRVPLPVHRGGQAARRRPGRRHRRRHAAAAGGGDGVRLALVGRHRADRLAPEPGATAADSCAGAGHRARRRRAARAHVGPHAAQRRRARAPLPRAAGRGRRRVLGDGRQWPPDPLLREGGTAQLRRPAPPRRGCRHGQAAVGDARRPVRPAGAGGVPLRARCAPADARRAAALERRLRSRAPFHAERRAAHQRVRQVRWLLGRAARHHAGREGAPGAVVHRDALPGPVPPHPHAAGAASRGPRARRQPCGRCAVRLRRPARAAGPGPGGAVRGRRLARTRGRTRAAPGSPGPPARACPRPSSR
jgi:hypothetical protein